MSRYSFSERDERPLGGVVACSTCGVWSARLVGDEEQDADQIKRIHDHLRMCIERAAALKLKKSVA